MKQVTTIFILLVFVQGITLSQDRQTYLKSLYQTAMNQKTGVATEGIPISEKILNESVELNSSGLQSSSASSLMFADSTHLLQFDSIFSGCAMAAADMNCDGLDDLVRFSGADTLMIEYQQADGTFSGYAYGFLNNSGSEEEWNICIADVDHNGYNDILTGGNFNRIKLISADVIGEQQPYALLDKTPFGFGIYSQAANIADINNDGWLDYFSCNDVGYNSTYRNDGSGQFLYDTTFAILDTRPILPAGDSSGTEEYSGNYGSIFSDIDSDGDLDLYISKCRAGVSDSIDSRRVNQLFINDGTNQFTDLADSLGLRPLKQSWSAVFGDLDNDGDQDCFIIHHFSRSQIFRNDGDSIFVDVTSSTGQASNLDFVGFGIQCMMEDFDNDGFVDIYMTTLNGGNLMMQNDGDFTFTSVDIVSVMGGSGAQSAVIGDFNHDGFPDLLAGFAQGFNQPNTFGKSDKLLLNKGNSNHFLNVSLVGTTSNINGIGARIEVYSDLGMQIREVRAGESYGIQHSMSKNFGLGANTVVDSVIVKWPSGNVDKHENIAADQFIKLREGCVGVANSHLVTTTADDGAGSLRQIINDACDGDIIYFNASLANDTIVLSSSEIMIDKSITISGIDGSEPVISGNQTNRVFNIKGTADVALSNLEIIRSAGAGNLGGAIFNAGNLTMENVTMYENQKDGLPRAIENVGTLTIDTQSVIVEE